MLKVKSSAGREYEIVIEDGNFIINNEILKPDIAKISETAYHLLLHNKSYQIRILKNEGKFYEIEVNGNVYKLESKDKYDILLEQMGLKFGGNKKLVNIKAPMPGLVIDVLVKDGQEVLKDTPLLILEAMKMENVIKATSDAVIEEVLVKKKETVEKNSILITFK